MEVLIESWCFCKGASKSEKMKAAIFTGKGQAMVKINISGNAASGTGFLINRNLLLTTHGTILSVMAAESCEIRLQNGQPATLFPHRFFISSSVLDLTIVGLDAVDGDSNGQPLQYLKTCTKPSLDLGSVVYLLGYTNRQEFVIGEGKVIIATDNLIKLTTDGIVWSPGSAGFDVQGNLAFMICDPMKLATSPNTKSSSRTSSSSSSWKKDIPMQFGIPMLVICDWLNHHWEGNLDDFNKPKLPIIRMMSSGQKSDHSCASFSMKQVFKPVESESDGSPSSSIVLSRPMDQGQSSYSVAKVVEETLMIDTKASHLQGIPTPEIFESPKVTAAPLRKKEISQVQLLDINFPPRIAKPTGAPQSAKLLLPVSDENRVKKALPENQLDMEQVRQAPSTLVGIDAEIASTDLANGAESEVQCSSSRVRVPEMHDEYSSEGETTMYSAETAESRNYTSPKEVKLQQVGRSQSCVSYNRWDADAAHSQRNPAARSAILEKQRSYIHGRKMHSQGHPSHRSNGYCSPTVSSIMKKRTNSAQTHKPRPSVSVVNSSPKWVF